MLADGRRRQSAEVYRFSPGGGRSDALAINGAGHVVGDAQLADGSIHPFIWDPLNGMRDLGGGHWGNASAINNLDQVVGSTAVRQIEIEELGEGGTVTATFDVLQPFIWDSVNGMRLLETPPGAIESYASGINDDGLVVGQVQVAGVLSVSGMVGGQWHAVMWDSSGHMQDLGTLGGGSSSAYGINEASQVVGFSNIAGSDGFQGVTHSFIWDLVNGMRDLSLLVGDETFRVADHGINEDGMVAGTFISAANEYRLAGWNPLDGFRDLGSLNTEFFAYASAINDFGGIVGSSDGSSDEGFLYDPGHGIQSLSFGTASSAFGINNAGQVVGSYQSASGEDFRAFLLNPPDPVLAGTSPNMTIGGVGNFTLTVNGSDFRHDAAVLWNGSERATTFLNSSQLTAEIPAADVAGGADIVTALVTVRNPNGAISNPESFTITPANVSVVQSSAADAGQTAASSTAPSVAGDAGVTAVVQNTGSDPVTVTVANYSSNPSGAAFSAGGGFTDLQITGATSSMTATANFYYPSTTDSATEVALTLVYFNGLAWVSVRSDGNADPAKDMTDNLDGTVSGGRFTVVFSDTSTPRITQLSGTFFALGIPPKIAFTGFLSPIGDRMIPAGTSSTPLRTFKMQSVIPVKFSATLAGSAIFERSSYVASN